jgi:hypothetical protein
MENIKMLTQNHDFWNLLANIMSLLNIIRAERKDEEPKCELPLPVNEDPSTISSAKTSLQGCGMFS